MTLYKPTFESVSFIASRVRAADAEEILPLRFDPSPAGLAQTVMSNPTFVWLAAQEGKPIAVFGMFEVRPKAWTAFAFGTDDFPKVASEMTKFLIRTVRPHLFGVLGARRVEAHSHPAHKEAHAWLKLLGAKGEIDPDYGPNGETYVRFVMRRADWELAEAKKAARIVVIGCASSLARGGKPDFASPAAQV